MGFKDPALDFLDKILHISCGSAPCVHHEACVLGANLGTAHLEALEARLVYQRTGKANFGGRPLLLLGGLPHPR